MATIRCTACRYDNPHEARFCEQCGAPVTTGCTRCGSLMPASAKFCHDCGLPLVRDGSGSDPRTYTPRHLAEKILTTRAAL